MPATCKYLCASFLLDRLLFARTLSPFFVRVDYSPSCNFLDSPESQYVRCGFRVLTLMVLTLMVNVILILASTWSLYRGTSDAQEP